MTYYLLALTLADKGRFNLKVSSVKMSENRVIVWVKLKYAF
jgi:hypothetical protein